MGTDFTPVYRIPYPDRDATLCEAPEQLQAMAQKIDDSLTLVEADLPRFQNPPFARLSSRVGYSLVIDFNEGLGQGTANLIFDSVDVDTDNMANLSISPNGLFASRNGYYEIGAYAHLSASNAATTSFNFFRLDLILNPDVSALNGDIDTGDTTWDGGSGNVASYLYSVQEIQVQVADPATPGPLFLAQITKSGEFNSPHENDQTVAFSVAWARWMRDL